MSTLDDLQADLQRLLDGAGIDASLADLQFAYKTMIVKFGLLILNRYSDDLIGPKPAHGVGGGGPAPHGPGENPHDKPPASAGSHGPGEVPHILKLAGIALELDCP